MKMIHNIKIIDFYKINKYIIETTVYIINLNNLKLNLIKKPTLYI